MLFTKLFWQDATERIVSTFAQTFLALVAVIAPSTDTSLLAINYVPIVATALIAAGLSLLKAIAAAYKAGTDTASLTVDTKALIKKKK